IMESKVENDLINARTEELQQDKKRDFFVDLFQINFRYIDRYYRQTQQQANKSFLISAFASFVGLAIIVVGIVMMFKGETTPAYVTSGAGVVSEFISTIFFYLYNKTIAEMGEYHQKLVVTQNITVALKIAQDIEDGEKKSESQQKLIDRLTENINS